MELSHSWAGDYVKMPPAKRVVEIFNNAGLPVDAVHAGVAIPDSVIVGEVITAAKHPNADRLKVTTVDIGTGEPQPIVCGAANCKAGLKVAVAQVGTVLPNGTTIEKAKIRGEVSQGMLCAEDELGLGSDHNGIIELAQDAIVGKPAAQFLKGKDTVYTVDVMPNRPDCLSVIGLAREIAAAEGHALPVVKRTKKWSLARGRSTAEGGKSDVKVKVEDKKACPLFMMQYLTNVKIKPSPQWMQERLRAAGERPINNVVDITNYILLELGRPLHSFDAAKIANHAFTVRYAKPGEKLMTLDGKMHKLTKDMHVVADTNGVLSLAGVMGGKESEITQQTTEVLLEAAVWDKQMIYDTSHELKLVSESSQRFAKGVDRDMTLTGLTRATELLMECADAKPVGDPVIVGEQKEKHAAVNVSLKNLNAHLGTRITRQEAAKSLKVLGCGVSGSGDSIKVTPPSWRHDILIAEDVHEEVARLYGYDNIIRTIPNASGIPQGLPKSTQLVRMMRETLVRLGAHEHVGYAYVPESYITCHKEKAVQIANPLSKDQEFMRTCMTPGLLAVAEKNAKRFDAFRMFEFGKTYCRADKGFIEKEKLGMLVVEKPRGAGSGSAGNAVRVAKGMVEAMGSALGAAVTFGDTQVTQQPIFMNGIKVGKVSIPSADYHLQFKLPKNIVLVVLDLASVLENVGEMGRTIAEPIPQFPPVKRDLALWVPESVTYDALASFISKTHPLLTSIELFDVFHKENLVSYALHLTFSDEKRTLASAEVEKVFEQLKGDLKVKFKAEIR
ncbi:MAG: phenylalanine--tRNA ligase subunit beta [Patescibacteria group bacterium]|jgi:phenylalanyl-tRNA synthetase beta chain